MKNENSWIVCGLHTIFKVIIPYNIKKQSYTEIMHRTVVFGDEIGISARIYRIFGIRAGDAIVDGLKLTLKSD